ncbi:MAG: cupin domain-containing protein [Burkholderiaceae bacterium]
MNVVRQDRAPTYSAPGHVAMTLRRLQGREAGPSDTAWIGLSVIQPGGGTTLADSPVEKFYVVLEGEVEITAKFGDATQTATLHRLDSCRLAPGEARQLFNRTQQPASVLLVMPTLP